MKDSLIPAVGIGLMITGAMMILGAFLPPRPLPPCALPERMPAEIQLHDGMSATEANYKQWLSAELDGGTQ